jgi:aromatic ring-opening dioxygenase catalytic subunit (LigB family)
MTTCMPTLFVPHGAGPCFFMDWQPADTWAPMAAFLGGIAADLPQRPSAILLVSGHWLGPCFSVTSAAQPSLIYDYHGFPPHTYELSYPAPGSPALAGQVMQLLGRAGIGSAADPERGFDHGVFIPLKLIFPDANIPVVQLSLRSDLDPLAHLQAGRALAPLREQGVLILGSGMSFHNMRGYGDPRFTAPSAEFDAWLGDAIAAPAERRWAALQDWANAPSARLCHPARAEEHLLPLMLAAGAAQGSAGRKVFSDQVLETVISAFRFG